MEKPLSGPPGQKFVFITGGVISSLGKGLLSASLGALLEAQKYTISLIKCDPYLNVDPGTMSPFQHGEVYVTEDGAETDMDLGHYERFTRASLKKGNSITTGQVYESVILKERQGVYLGNTVQVIPHITDEIKARLKAAAGPADVVIVEIGGTVGDIESLPFIEAIRQMRVDWGVGNTAFIHLTLVPYVSSAGEVKSKPTQHSVKALREVGIQPDFLVCRTEREKISLSLKKKIALFCSVQEDNVIAAPNAQTIYEVPLLLQQEGLDRKLIQRLEMENRPSQMQLWKDIVSTNKNPQKVIRVGLVGKYVDLKDSYQSLTEALIHGGLAHKARVEVEYMDSETLNSSNVRDRLKNLSAVLIPGGFGTRGVEGKMDTIRYVRENNIPFLGICLGMQMAIVEFARHVCRMPGAASSEFENLPPTAPCVISDSPKYSGQKTKGGNMRLGSYACHLKEGSLAHKIYNQPLVYERHRHRFEFNNDFKEEFEKKGMVISGVNRKENLAEVVEIPSHPWFLGVQFHPEFKSKPFQPHPVFADFVRAALLNPSSRQQKIQSLQHS